MKDLNCPICGEIDCLHGPKARAESPLSLVNRKLHVHVCHGCAYKRGIDHTLNYGTLVGCVPAKLIRTPSTRLKTCFDCKGKFRDIYRLY